MGLSVGILPSLAIGAVAFGAGELVFHTKEQQEIKQKSFSEILQDAKNKNMQIFNMISKIEKESLQEQIKEIYETVKKIINTVEKNPEKYEKINNFFDYYLPVTLSILKRYDEIENQNLNSSESKKFMTQTQNMIEKINIAFKNQLSNLYQSDIVDTDAEMKVFETMLKADGYDTETDFRLKKEDNGGEK